ncbi:MAG: alcohol dehydrogenase catalytic domain-containing protein [Chloroflexi bacterium]|nr:alcohol dehydrogenase catalytic domain-containing protein [Chloroflexota bacterium]
MNSFFRVIELRSGEPVLTLKRCPEPTEDLIIIRPFLVGICRSDIKEIQGIRKHRSDFGHEVIGRIEWAGKLQSHLKGDLVCINPNIAISRNSGFAELIFARGEPALLSKAILRVVGNSPVETLVFIEPLSCAYHCISSLRSHLKLTSLNGLSIGIIGAGMSGTLIGLVSKHAGAKVSVFNRTMGRLNFLQERNVFVKNELFLVGEQVSPTFDIVIAATSNIDPAVMRFAEDMIKPNGLILLFGGTTRGEVFPDTDLELDRIRRQQELMIVRHHDKEFRIGGTYESNSFDFVAVMNYIEEFPQYYPLNRLITQIISLDQAPQMLAEMAELQYINYGKILVKIDLGNSATT